MSYDGVAMIMPGLISLWFLYMLHQIPRDALALQLTFYLPALVPSAHIFCTERLHNYHITFIFPGRGEHLFARRMLALTFKTRGIGGPRLSVPISVLPVSYLPHYPRTPIPTLQPVANNVSYPT